MEIDNIEEFVVIDKRIDAAEEEAGALLGETIRDRWEFGKLMLAARGLTKAGKPSKQLPNGYLDKLTEETGKSRAELQFRMQFAERYPTEDEVSKALDTLESWTQVIASLPKPSPEPEQSKSKTKTRGEGFSEVQKQELIRKVFEENKTKQIAEAEVMGWDEPKRDAGRQVHRLIAEEETRRDTEETILAEIPPIAWESIPNTSREKLEGVTRRIRKEVEREFAAKLATAAAEYRKQCDVNVAEHKAKVDARAKLERENRDRERARYDMLSKVHSAKGLISPSEYTTILACLHPDNSASEEKRTAAFRIFNDAKVKALLVNEVKQ